MGIKNTIKQKRGKITSQKIKERFIALHKTEEGRTLQKKMARGRCKHLYEIDQFSTDGTLLKTWKDMLEIRELYPSWSSNVSACLRGLRKTAHGFVWKKKHKF